MYLDFATFSDTFVDNEHSFILNNFMYILTEHV